MNHNNRNKFSEEDNEEQMMFQLGNNTPKMFRKTFTVNSFDYYIDDDVGPVDGYRDLIHTLHSASATDSIRVWVDTNGGHLDTALAIMDAFENTEADVTVIVTGRAYSAGSLIALAGMKFGQLVLGNRARFMIHSGSFGSGGNESEVEEHVKATLELIRNIKKEFYTGFLTDEEMKLLDIGKNYYFDAKEAGKRIKQRLAYLEDKQKPKPKKPAKPKTVPKPEYDPADVALTKAMIEGTGAEGFVQEFEKQLTKPKRERKAKP